MNLVKEAITAHFGDKCRDYEAGCPCCDVWSEYENAREDALREAASHLRTWGDIYGNTAAIAILALIESPTDE